MELAGKVAVVTGGASGLGEGTVRAYVAKGVKIAIFDLNEERATSIVNELGADNVAFFNVNVADEDSVAAGIAGAVEKFGAIHICNNFAGYGIAEKTYGKKGPHALDSYKKLIDVNLTGTFDVCRQVAEQMAKNEPFDEHGGRGVIINTASVAAYEGQIGQVAYSASKGGIVGMTLPMARDLAPVGIRVNAIVPGLIHTPLLESMPEQVTQALIATTMYPKRLGQPSEIGHLSIFMAENEYLNGQCIRLDSGMKMQPK